MLTIIAVAKAYSAANHIIYLRASQRPINTSTGVKLSSSTDDCAAVEFRDVTFAYPSHPDPPALDGLTLKTARVSQSVL